MARTAQCHASGRGSVDGSARDAPLARPGPRPRPRVDRNHDRNAKEMRTQHYSLT